LLKTFFLNLSFISSFLLRVEFIFSSNYFKGTSKNIHLFRKYFIFKKITFVTFQSWIIVKLLILVSLILLYQVFRFIAEILWILEHLIPVILIQKMIMLLSTVRFILRAFLRNILFFFRWLVHLLFRFYLIFFGTYTLF